MSELKILLDNSPGVIDRKSKKYDYEFWQLRTPLTRHAITDRPYGLDNGCFSKFEEKTWKRMVREGMDNHPIFCCMPDIVGDAQRTVDMMWYWHIRCYGVPITLVLQDGIGKVPIDWNIVDSVFIGGSDQFKISQEAFSAAKSAKMLGKWVHVGRVNTPRRVLDWLGIADSIDGSGISKYDHMLEAVLDAIREDNKQQCLLGGLQDE